MPVRERGRRFLAELACSTITTQMERCQGYRLCMLKKKSSKIEALHIQMTLEDCKFNSEILA